MISMVIVFSSHKPRRHLLENGQVYTVRIKKKKMKPWYLKKDWMTDKRGGKKIADVFVEYWFSIKRDELETVLIHYVKNSGFLTVSEWLQEIKRLAKGKLPPVLHLYRVLLVK